MKTNTEFPLPERFQPFADGVERLYRHLQNHVPLTGWDEMLETYVEELIREYERI